MWARKVVGNDRYVWYSSTLVAGAVVPPASVAPSPSPVTGELKPLSNGSGRVETEGDMPRFEGASLLSVRFRTCDGARLWPKWIDDALEEGWEEPL